MTTPSPIANLAHAGPPQGQWTADDVLVWCTADDGNRYELIDGVVLMTTQPHWRHQGISTELATVLNVWNKAHRAGRVLIAPGVIFAPRDVVAPDLVWVGTDRLPSLLDEDGKLHGAPDLVVEILSPGKEQEERDRITKLELYERYGVQEYWIVDRFQRQVEVYRLVESDLQRVQTVTEYETLTSPLLPGFACLVADLFVA